MTSLANSIIQATFSGLSAFGSVAMMFGLLFFNEQRDVLSGCLLFMAINDLIFAVIGILQTTYVWDLLSCERQLFIAYFFQTVVFLWPTNTIFEILHQLQSNLKIASSSSAGTLYGVAPKKPKKSRSFGLKPADSGGGGAAAPPSPGTPRIEPIAWSLRDKIRFFWYLCFCYLLAALCTGPILLFPIVYSKSRGQNRCDLDSSHNNLYTFVLLDVAPVLANICNFLIFVKMWKLRKSTFQNTGSFAYKFRVLLYVMPFLLSFSCLFAGDILQGLGFEVSNNFFDASLDLLYLYGAFIALVYSTSALVVEPSGLAEVLRGATSRAAFVRFLGHEHSAPVELWVWMDKLESAVRKFRKLEASAGLNNPSITISSPSNQTQNGSKNGNNFRRSSAIRTSSNRSGVSSSGQVSRSFSVGGGGGGGGGYGSMTIGSLPASVMVRPNGINKGSFEESLLPEGTPPNSAVISTSHSEHEFYLRPASSRSAPSIHNNLPPSSFEDPTPFLPTPKKLFPMNSFWGSPKSPKGRKKLSVLAKAFEGDISIDIPGLSDMDQQESNAMKKAREAKEKCQKLQTHILNNFLVEGSPREVAMSTESRGMLADAQAQGSFEQFLFVARYTTAEILGQDWELFKTSEHYAFMLTELRQDEAVNGRNVWLRLFDKVLGWLKKRKAPPRKISRV